MVKSVKRLLEDLGYVLEYHLFGEGGRHGEFDRVFEFRPGEKIESLDEETQQKVQQAKVNAVLWQLTAECAKWIYEVDRIPSLEPEPQNKLEARARIQALGRAATALQQAIRSLKLAHALARGAGFEVPESWEGYLPKELRVLETDCGA